MNIKRHIPNFITLLNLSCGCMASMMAFEGFYTQAFLFMVGSLIFDFLDGFAARLLKSYSDMGRELDSLADVVSFGFVPGVLMWHIGGGFYFGFLITLFSALRLAKFNVDTREHDVFYGLATPASAIFFCSIAFVIENMPTSFVAVAMSNEIVRWVLVVLFAYLMICDLPMFSLKFKSWGVKDNALVYGFLLCSLIAIVVFGVLSLPFIILSYIVLSVLLKVGGKRCIE